MQSTWKVPPLTLFSINCCVVLPGDDLSDENSITQWWRLAEQLSLPIMAKSKCVFVSRFG